MCLAAALAAPVSFGADAARQQAQARLLDRAAFLCDDCLFGASDYYYCFAADNRILIGYQKTPVLNYTDKSKNYLAPAHPSWAAWTAPGQSVPIAYDDKYIWVSRTPEVKRGFRAGLQSVFFWASRANSKQVRLKRSSIRDIFTGSDQCRGAGGAKAN